MVLILRQNSVKSVRNYIFKVGRFCVKYDLKVANLCPSKFFIYGSIEAKTQMDMQLGVIYNI